MAIKDVSVVLAHGAWADGSSWARVITALKAEGVKVSAAPLPLTSLADDVAALNRSLDRTRRPDRAGGTRLCRRGHSAGASRTGEGAGLCDRACSRRGREGRGRVLSPRTPSPGAEACAGQQWPDLAARRQPSRRRSRKTHPRTIEPCSPPCSGRFRWTASPFRSGARFGRTFRAGFWLPKTTG